MKRSVMSWLGCCLALSLLLTGCPGSNTSNSSGTTTGSGTTNPSNSDSGQSATGSTDQKNGSSDQSNSGSGDQQVKIAFVTNCVADFWDIAKQGCIDAAKDFDVECTVRFPDLMTATRQKQIVEDLLALGIKGLAVSLPDAANQIDMVNEWGQRVPLITHDSDAPGSNRLLYIGMDNYAAGRMVGELIKKQYPNGAKLCLFVGNLEQDNAQKRRQGVIDELFGRPIPTDGKITMDPADGVLENNGFTIYATLTDQGSPEVSKQKAEDAINAYSEMNLMVGLFEYNPPAIIQALRQSNKLSQMGIVGFDENAQTLQGIKDGHVLGTVVQNPYEYGYQSVRVLASLVRGDKSVIPASKYIDVAPRSITKENVDEFWADLRAKSGAN